MRITSFCSFTVFCAAWVGCGMASATAATVPPTNPEEVKARVAELRRQYEPYLRSLPKPLPIRRQTPLGPEWRTKFELDLPADASDYEASKSGLLVLKPDAKKRLQSEAESGTRPEPPAWFGEDFDDSGWEPATVPEWRYAGQRNLPGSRILWYRQKFDAQRPNSTQRTFLVFAGVDWEAQVWLNGKYLGSHKVYYEPFRFDVTDMLKGNNTLVVRVLDGPKFGEPVADGSLFATVEAQDQRYVRDKARSMRGFTTHDVFSGNGFGIHREVYLETTGEAVVTDVFARCKPETPQADVTFETDAAAAKHLTFDVQILPENFDGRSYRASATCDVPKGPGKQTIAIPMPEAKSWTPETPYLYRCRVSLSEAERLVDAEDVLFGNRSFGLVSKLHPHDGLPEGMFLLNGRPIYLRGSNVQGLDTLWYWKEQDELIDVVMMLKAGNFNALRSHHVSFPEVNELLDRLGILSQQAQGCGGMGGAVSPEQLVQLVDTGTTLARVCYNNPGVVMLAFGNETAFDPSKVLAAALAVDPERILKPISGINIGNGKLAIPESYWANVVSDIHDYNGWYGGNGKIWTLSKIRKPGRLVTVGEFGGEALDGYETMSRHYPAHWPKTPPADADVLFGQQQVQKADARQIVGFRGRRPTNLEQYIEASQTYQADLLAEEAKGFRLSPRTIGGYFQFQFIDVVPANWPKSIISNDLRPKKGYYAMAQANQPLVPLWQLLDGGKSMELWIANDLPERFEHCRLQWTVRVDGKTLVRGEKAVDVPAADAVMVEKADLADVPQETSMATIDLVLADTAGATLSRYQREIFLKAWRSRDSVFHNSDK